MHTNNQNPWTISPDQCQGITREENNGITSTQWKPDLDACCTFRPLDGLHAEISICEDNLLRTAWPCSRRPVHYSFQQEVDFSLPRSKGGMDSSLPAGRWSSSLSWDFRQVPRRDCCRGRRQRWRRTLVPLRDTLDCLADLHLPQLHFRTWILRLATCRDGSPW